THSFSAGLWGRIAAILARTPYVVTTIHTVAGWAQPLKLRIGNQLLQPFTDRIVAVSESVRRSLIRQGFPRDAIQVIYNGICVERFRRSTSVAGDRKRLGLNPDGPLVGMIGRCSPEKGGSDWVQMMATLARSDARVQGVLVGNGPEQASWRALATAEGVADQIRFVGIKTDIVPWLAVMDVLVCPSIQESFGIAALEAQAAGVPVVATRVDGFLEALHDGEDALLVESGNAIGMAVAVQSLLASNDLASRLADGGRRNVGGFGIDKTAQHYAALYWKLLGVQNAKS
ncbi:MAG: glycosyltransferase family 4 protein, partial [bacterium]